MFGLVALVDILLDLLRGVDVTLAILLFIVTASPVRILKRVRQDPDDDTLNHFRTHRDAAPGRAGRDLARKFVAQSQHCTGAHVQAVIFFAAFPTQPGRASHARPSLPDNASPPASVAWRPTARRLWPAGNDRSAVLPDAAFASSPLLAARFMPPVDHRSS
jgi:hypothetical protein